MKYFIENIGSEKEVEKYFNKSINQLKSEMSEMIKEQLKTEQMQTTITKNITSTPSEVRTYFRQLPKDKVPMIGSVESLSIRRNFAPGEPTKLVSRVGPKVAPPTLNVALPGLEPGPTFVSGSGLRDSLHSRAPAGRPHGLFRRGLRRLLSLWPLS